MRMPCLGILIYSFGCAGGLVRPAHAETIGIAFHNGTTTGNAMAPATAPTTQGTVVHTDTESWNNVINTSGVGLVFSNFALLNSAGAGSGAALSVNSGYSGYNSIGWNTRNKDWVMMEGWYGFRAAESLTVSNLPAAFTSNGYQVVLYGDANTARTMNYFLGGATRTIADSTNFAGDFSPFTVIFTGLSNANFTLTGNPNAGDSRSAVNGLRIVANPVVTPVVGIGQFTAAPSRIQPGGAATLSWRVTDATAVTLLPDGGDVTALTTNGAGAVTVAPTNTTAYTLIATNAQSALTASATVRVVVGPPVPNLLVFLVDDMGWQDTSVPFNHDAGGTAIVSALNRRYRTPAMERLAASGMKFTAAYSAPVCSPTRVGIMTGKNTARHRVTNWTTPDGGEPGGSSTPDLKPPSGWLRTGMAATETNTLPRLLAQAGYRTIHVGKAHFGSIGSPAQFPQNIGFEVNIAGSEIGHPASYYGTNNFGSGSNHVPGLESYHGRDIFLTEALTLEMNKQIEGAVTSGVPFFAYMAHYAVHSPWNPDGRFATNYPGLTGSQLAFATLIEGMDKSLGDILNRLEALGVAENTLVVFLSDNGGDNVNTPLRSKKGTLYEGGVRVPMIWSWAGTNSANPFQAALPIAPGSRQDDRAVAWDLYPTLLGLAGATGTPPVDGQDLGGYLRGAPGFHRTQQFAIHYPHHRENGAASQNPGSIWRDGDWKLIHDYQTGASELYNLADDLSETNDLAASQPERAMSMSRALARELNRLGALFPERIISSAPVPPVMPNLPALDLDGDGLPDLSEDVNANGLRDPGETDPDLSDTDGDRTPDGAELRTGTDPLNPESSFVAFLAATNGQPDRLSWPSKTGTFYRVERSLTLAPGSWGTAADDVAGESVQTFFNLPQPPPGEAAGFFRVVLK